uniref:Opioid growth factor receptor (OGFr) conserved domain-containing protein n=1 Tax=Cyprinus carpio TaxID=7962 RepID=A0A8C2DQQ6_CYPCA
MNMKRFYKQQSHFCVCLHVFHRWSCRNMYAARNMQDFRHSCRVSFLQIRKSGVKLDLQPNLAFYHGQIKSSPDDVHIDEFHQQWWGEYERLEDVHSYIQRLFPIQERGVNWRAHLFRKDKQAKSKLVKSYKLMLDFYGLRLANESTGEVERAPNWKDRFRNLNRFTHNNLRITRILKCLGTLGLKHYQAPLVKFFLHETLVVGHLSNVKQSSEMLLSILSRVVHCKKENVEQPIENKLSSTVEDQLKRLNKDEAVIPNKPTETNSDQGANENSQCRLETDYITPANMSHGDNDDSGPHQTEVSLYQM